MVNSLRKCRIIVLRLSFYSIGVPFTKTTIIFFIHIQSRYQDTTNSILHIRIEVLNKILTILSLCMLFWFSEPSLVSASYGRIISEPTSAYDSINTCYFSAAVVFCSNVFFLLWDRLVFLLLGGRGDVGGSLLWLGCNLLTEEWLSLVVAVSLLTDFATWRTDRWAWWRAPPELLSLCCAAFYFI
jgi:hypothetical protein